MVEQIFNQDDESLKNDVIEHIKKYALVSINNDLNLKFSLIAYKLCELYQLGFTPSNVIENLVRYADISDIIFPAKIKHQFRLNNK